MAIIDSQSVRTAVGGEECGYDAGKKIIGRKRHLAVDMLGLVWAVALHGAYWQDYEGGHFVLAQLSQACRGLKAVFGDSVYAREGLPEWVRNTFGWILQTVLRPVQAKGFGVLPKRWIVQRTFAWLCRHRRHDKRLRTQPTDEQGDDLHRHDLPDVTPADATTIHLKTRSYIESIEGGSSLDHVRLKCASSAGSTGLPCCRKLMISPYVERGSPGLISRSSRNVFSASVISCCR